MKLATRTGLSGSMMAVLAFSLAGCYKADTGRPGENSPGQASKPHTASAASTMAANQVALKITGMT